MWAEVRARAVAPAWNTGGRIEISSTSYKPARNRPQANQWVASALQTGIVWIADLHVAVDGAFAKAYELDVKPIEWARGEVTFIAPKNSRDKLEVSANNQCRIAGVCKCFIDVFAG